MSFREHLEEVCKVDGAVAASVMGFDGIAIDTVTPQDAGVDLQTLLVEFTAILGQIRTAAEVLQTGTVNEVSIGTEKITTLVRLINPEYFLVLAMRPEGNYGKGRYVL